MKLSHKGRERHNRKVAVRSVIGGKTALRVIKVDDGYQLASVNGHTVSFGQIFAKESEAVKEGERKFGMKAKRIVKRVAA